MTPRLDTREDFAPGLAHLAEVCPVWRAVLPRVAPHLPLYRRTDGFAAILDAVSGQQLSVAAAASIRAKLAAAGLDTEAAIAAAPDEALRACGVSGPKIRHLRGIVAAGVDWDGLRDLPDEAAKSVLVALPGVGPWTADIYLMFALGRPDVLAEGDLALQEAARRLYGLPDRPTPKALLALAAPWRPWRAVAARALWAYYRLEKGREGI